MGLAPIPTYCSCTHRLDLCGQWPVNNFRWPSRAVFDESVEFSGFPPLGLLLHEEHDEAVASKKNAETGAAVSSSVQFRE